ncbi:MAG: hypothetical protein JRN24_00410 [Nitrososphaerota archaeon]|nr:hypothetical protein [Nitrososphaerota archaeon]
MDKNSKTVNMAAEYKKLALRYKTLEAQLRQSISKKEHHEVVFKLEKEVEGLEKELDRAKAEQQKNSAMNKQFSSLEEQLATQSRASSTQARMMESVAAKIAQGFVASSVHLQALSRNRELEEQIRGMVSKDEYSSLQRRYEEVSRQIGSMVQATEYYTTKQKLDDVTRQLGTTVPASQYTSLKAENEELENAVSSMVPRDQLITAEAKVQELEAKLAEHVPQAIYDELVSKVVALAEEVTGGSHAAEAESAPQADEQPTQAPEAFAPEPSPGPMDESPSEPFEPMTISDEMVAQASQEPAPEITEVQTQLAELTSRANEATEIQPERALTSDETSINLAIASVSATDTTESTA